MRAKTQSLEHSGWRAPAPTVVAAKAGAGPAAALPAVMVATILGVLAPLTAQAQSTSRTPAATAPPGQAVLARSGRYAYPESSLRDVLAIDAAILESPLSDAEQTQVRTLVIDEFNRDPAKIVAVIPTTHRLAGLFHDGAGYDIASTREKYWENTLKLAQSDALAARWLEIMRRHVAIIVAANGYVVTMHQVNALFASSDYIAGIAGQPKSTPEQRAAFAKSLPGRFAQMSPVEQEQIAHSESRLVASQANIFKYNDLHAKAVTQIRANVQGPDDVPKEARRLEDWGIKFQNVYQTFATRQQAINGEQAKLDSVKQINMATRQFRGQGR